MSRHEVKIKIVTSMGNIPFYRSTMWLINEFQNIQNFEQKLLKNYMQKSMLQTADLRFRVLLI